MVTVGQFLEKAKEVCATANVNQPFMCLDLAYISTLLTDGYELDTTTKIDVSFLFSTKGDVNIANIIIEHMISFQLYKKVDDHEISWAIGCAYNILAGISRETKTFVN